MVKKQSTDHLGNKYMSFINMCKAYGKPAPTVRSRLKAGWSLEDALTIPAGEKSLSYIKSADHLGNEYKNFTEMCQAYGKSLETVNARLNRGWTLEDALTIPIDETKCLKSVDHLGNEYDTFSKMCQAYKKGHRIVRARLNMGWPLEKALTTPAGETKCLKSLDHLGNEYSSFTEMCRLYEKNPEIVNHRLNKGWTLENALTVPIGESHEKYIKSVDHLGNEYRSFSKMCEAYDKCPNSVKGRLKRGWTLEEALTIPIGETNTGGATDHFGNKFKSFTKMCNAYKLDRRTVERRLQLGWELKEALTVPIGENSSIKCTDHLGNNYNSFTEMCKAYDKTYSGVMGRMKLGWTLEEALTIPKHMYIGEYKVAECLKRLNIKFYHDCTMEMIFSDLDICVDWNEFLSELQKNLQHAGINWTKKKIERLRPDFVIYTDDDNKIRGVIEFDGEQHQNFVEFFFKTIEQFLKRSDLDFVKQSLWEHLNIPMMRIRYDQIEYIDNMVSDFTKNPQNYIKNHNTYLSEEEYWSTLSNMKEIYGW